MSAKVIVYLGDLVLSRLDKSAPSLISFDCSVPIIVTLRPGRSVDSAWSKENNPVLCVSLYSIIVCAAF
jgi:hypothetical protein